MSGAVADRKRLIRVTGANLKHGHLYVTGHYDFFPPDIIGSNLKSKPGVPITIELTGLGRAIQTDIASEKDGAPRRHFRERKAFAAFFEHHDIQPGDVLALERRNEREYRLYPFHTAKDRNHDWHRWLDEPLETEAPTVLELFAGCGGMGLGFKRAGFECAMAVEWDKAACDTLRANVTERVAQCAIEEVEQFPKADVVIGGPPCQGFSNLGERVA